MALIVKRGEIPATPHTEFEGKPGAFSLEEIHGVYGFSGAWSRKMHLRSYPTEQVRAPKKASFSFAPEPAPLEAAQPFMIDTQSIPLEGNALTGRRCVITGPSTRITLLKTDQGFPQGTFFRNGENHELYYVHEGKGTLHTEYGRLNMQKERYVLVPKGTTYRIEVAGEPLYALLVESKLPIEWPSHYLNTQGQAHMVSPVVETEIELPELDEPLDERGAFPVFMQHRNGSVTELTLGHHPFDLCGWEGALYPFVFDINNHHGIAREIHTAPPAHQTFESGRVPYNGFSLCSFVPQPDGWHPKDVAAPYAHYNVDSDEVMFFCNTSYGARKGIIQEGSLTFHPGSIPHSPHGEAAKNSTANRGKMSERLAVMLDTYFESLEITKTGLQYARSDYAVSWSEEKS